MSLDLQEWLALAIVIMVASVALWRRWTHKKASACNDCAIGSCGPDSGGPPLPIGVKTDPYRPRLIRPKD